MCNIISTFLLYNEDLTSVFEASQTWCEAERAAYRRMLRRVMGEVVARLMRGQLESGRLSVTDTDSGARLRSFVCFSGFEITVVICSVDFDGDGDGDDDPGCDANSPKFEQRTLRSRSRIKLHDEIGEQWSIDVLEGAPEFGTDEVMEAIVEFASEANLSSGSATSTHATSTQASATHGDLAAIHFRREFGSDFCGVLALPERAAGETFLSSFSCATCEFDVVFSAGHEEGDRSAGGGLQDRREFNYLCRHGLLNYSIEKLVSFPPMVFTDWNAGSRDALLLLDEDDVAARDGVVFKRRRIKERDGYLIVSADLFSSSYEFSAPWTAGLRGELLSVGDVPDAGLNDCERERQSMEFELSYGVEDVRSVDSISAPICLPIRLRFLLLDYPEPLNWLCSASM